MTMSCFSLMVYCIAIHFGFQRCRMDSIPPDIVLRHKATIAGIYPSGLDANYDLSVHGTGSTLILYTPHNVCPFFNQ